MSKITSAEELLNNPLLTKIIKAMHDRYYAAWAKAKKVEDREAIHSQLRANIGFINELKNMASIEANDEKRGKNEDS